MDGAECRDRGLLSVKIREDMVERKVARIASERPRDVTIGGQHLFEGAVLTENLRRCSTKRGTHHVQFPHPLCSIPPHFTAPS